MSWRDLSQAELDAEYTLSRLVPDLSAELERYAQRSARARRDHRVLAGLRYGDSDAETLDFFPAARPGAPLHVFVHGGFWQESDKDSSAFAAPGFLAQDVAFAAINYGLAPAHHLAGMVAMTRRAVRWLLRNGPGLGVDPTQVCLSGSSAGAHLVAMALLDGIPVAGAVLLSGVYDLEPVVHTWVNDALGLSERDARRLSPLLLPLPAGMPPVLIARGEGETAEFARQHEQMAARLRSVTRVSDLVAAGRTHFDLPYDLPDPATPLGAAVLAQRRLARNPAVQATQTATQKVTQNEPGSCQSSG